MSTRTTDRRTERTCSALRQALAQEIHATGDLSRVTVTAVTERAGVTRRTFYSHYSSIPDFVRSVEDDAIRDMTPLVSQISEVTLPELENALQTFSPCPGAVELLAHCRRDGEVLSALLGSGGDPAFAERIRETTCDLMHPRALAGFAPEVAAAFDYYLTFVVCAEVGVLARWLTTGMREPDDLIARIMTGLAFVRPGDLYGRPLDIDMAALLSSATTWDMEKQNG